MAKVRILCLSIWYPLAMSRYFEKALRHNESLDIRTTGPYTGSWIPWGGTGMSLPMKYAIPPDLPLPLPPNIGEVNWELVKAQLGDWKPDLVLTIDAGIRWKHKPTEGLVAHVATDPHVLNYDSARKMSDRFFNMQKCYSQGGDIYLPYAYSQYDHFPDDTVSKSADAALIGMPYTERIQWVNALRERHVSVLFENGPVYDEARHLYNQVRIGLNWSSKNDMNARVFEIMAMKLAPVINYVPDLDIFGYETCYLEFSALSRAVDLVVQLKENPKSASDIAETAYRVVQPHTYDARVNQILKECGLL